MNSIFVERKEHKMKLMTQKIKRKQLLRNFSGRKIK